MNYSFLSGLVNFNLILSITISPTVTINAPAKPKIRPESYKVETGYLSIITVQRVIYTDAHATKACAGPPIPSETAYKTRL